MTTYLATSPAASPAAAGHRRPACWVPLGIAALVLVAACGGDPAAPAGSAADDPDASAATAGAASDTDAGAGGTQAAATPEAAGHATGITVVGEGRVEVTPDVARAVVGVEVTRSDPGDAFADASSAATAVLNALRDEGVADHHLRTVELSLRQDRQPGPDLDTVETRGYLARNLVEVTVVDLDRVGELLGVAVDAGGPDARVEHVGLAVEAPELDDARQAAFDDARRRAEQYAGLAGRSLGPLLALSELDGGPGPLPRAEVADAAGVAAPPVEPGQQQVAVVVTATWQLGP